MPGNGRVEDKKQEKVEKYQALVRKLWIIWNTSVTIVTIVVVALGTVCNLKEELIKPKICKKEISEKTNYKIHEKTYEQIELMGEYYSRFMKEW